MEEIQTNFDRFYSLLTRSRDKTYVNDVLFEIDNSEVLFSDGSILEKDHVFETYQHRMSQQNNLGLDNMVEGYVDLLENLKKDIGSSIHVLSLTGLNDTYTFFTNVPMTKVVGILRSKARGIERLKALLNVYADKKLPVSNRSFFKGKLQEK